MSQKPKLNTMEFESVLLYLFVSLSMAIRAVFLITMSNDNIIESDFYLLMDAIMPVQIWGLVMLVGALFVIGCTLSISTRKYVLLIVGCIIGFIAGGSMMLLGFIAGMNIYTPLQTGIIAFFNLLLIIHGGVVLWREKRKIHTSPK